MISSMLLTTVLRCPAISSSDKLAIIKPKSFQYTLSGSKSLLNLCSSNSAPSRLLGSQFWWRKLKTFFKLVIMLIKFIALTSIKWSSANGFWTWIEVISRRWALLAPTSVCLALTSNYSTIIRISLTFSIRARWFFWLLELLVWDTQSVNWFTSLLTFDDKFPINVVDCSEKVCMLRGGASLLPESSLPSRCSGGLLLNFGPFSML